MWQIFNHPLKTITDPCHAFKFSCYDLIIVYDLITIPLRCYCTVTVIGYTHKKTNKERLKCLWKDREKNKCKSKHYCLCFDIVTKTVYCCQQTRKFTPLSTTFENFFFPLILWMNLERLSVLYNFCKLVTLYEVVIRAKGKKKYHFSSFLCLLIIPLKCY